VDWINIHGWACHEAFICEQKYFENIFLIQGQKEYWTYLYLIFRSRDGYQDDNTKGYHESGCNLLLVNDYMNIIILLLYKRLYDMNFEVYIEISFIQFDLI
jgi:hypothetical protein